MTRVAVTAACDACPGILGEGLVKSRGRDGAIGTSAGRAALRR